MKSSSVLKAKQQQQQQQRQRPFLGTANLIQVLSWFKKERESESNVEKEKVPIGKKWLPIKLRLVRGEKKSQHSKIFALLASCNTLSDTSPVSPFIWIQSFSSIYLSVQVYSCHHSSLFFTLTEHQPHSCKITLSKKDNVFQR